MSTFFKRFSHIINDNNNKRKKPVFSGQLKIYTDKCTSLHKSNERWLEKGNMKYCTQHRNSRTNEMRMPLNTPLHSNNAQNEQALDFF